MVTIDQFFLNFATSDSPKMEDIVSSRDFKVLKSLHLNLTKGIFFTINQSDLLKKILMENKEKIASHYEDFENILKLSLWSKPFRTVETVRKIYLSDNTEKEIKIIIEFSFSSNLRKIMQEISKNLTNLEPVTNGKFYIVDLDEKNIVTLVESFKNHKFSIDEKIIEYYNTIKSWKKEEIFGQFDIESILNQNFQKAISDDLGIETPLTQAIINDRRIRYQYFCKPIIEPKNLAETLAMREKSYVWLDKNKHSLDEIIVALKELRRLPILVVFDSQNEKQCFEDLKNLSENLEKNDIFTDVGIYFRFDNTEDGSTFNKYVAEKKYNSRVTKDTKIVGIQNGKIPKFLMKSDWKPMSVISLNNNLRNNKTSAYANCCDLVIAYTEKEPIIV